ncbi:MAG TPA: hypothetical protein VFO78_11195, partial [Candidatus Limnocylindrales bacterium]|nr:hypothetical protein [Candidatus Limnocylindrales bacterium]
MNRRRYLPAALGLAVFALSVPLGFALAADPVAELRQATKQFHDVGAAGPAGYAPFYICTDNEGLGAAMGQHYADVSKVVDPTIDPLDPEVLVYEPKPGGGLRLVAVEYVVFQADWDALHPNPPQLFGRTFSAIPAGNRYGLPDFYELHV